MEAIVYNYVDVWRSWHLCWNLLQSLYSTCCKYETKLENNLHNTQEIYHIVLMTASYHSNDNFLLDLRPNDFHGVNASLYHNHQSVGRLQFLVIICTVPIELNSFYGQAPHWYGKSQRGALVLNYLYYHPAWGKWAREIFTINTGVLLWIHVSMGYELIFASYLLLSHSCHCGFIKNDVLKFLTTGSCESMSCVYKCAH